MGRFAAVRELDVPAEDFRFLQGWRADVIGWADGVLWRCDMSPQDRTCCGSEPGRACAGTTTRAASMSTSSDVWSQHITTTQN